MKNLNFKMFSGVVALSVVLAGGTLTQAWADAPDCTVDVRAIGMHGRPFLEDKSTDIDLTLAEKHYITHSKELPGALTLRIDVDGETDWSGIPSTVSVHLTPSDAGNFGASLFSKTMSASPFFDSITERRAMRMINAIPNCEDLRK